MSIAELESTEDRPSQSTKKILRFSFSLYMGLVHIQIPLVHALVDEETLKPLSPYRPMILFYKKLLPVLYFPTIETKAMLPGIFCKMSKVSFTSSSYDPFDLTSYRVCPSLQSKMISGTFISRLSYDSSICSLWLLNIIILIFLL